MSKVSSEYDAKSGWWWSRWSLWLSLTVLCYQLHFSGVSGPPGPRPPRHVGTAAPHWANGGSFVATVHDEIPERSLSEAEEETAQDSRGLPRPNFNAFDRCGRRARLCVNTVEELSDAKTVTGPPQCSRQRHEAIHLRQRGRVLGQQR